MTCEIFSELPSGACGGPAVAVVKVEGVWVPTKTVCTPHLDSLKKLYPAELSWTPLDFQEPPC